MDDDLGVEIPLTTLAASVHGAAELDQRDGGFSPRRLPLWTRQQEVGWHTDFVAGCTSGVRLVLRTSASRLRLDATFKRNATETAPQPFAAVVLVAEVDGVVADVVRVDDGDVIVGLEGDSSRLVPGEPSTIEFDLDGDHAESGVPPATRDRNVVIWLPHTAETQIHSGSANAPVASGREPERPRWVHYGSSISHCMEAETPLGVWPVAAARQLDVSLVNLGLAGNAMLDPFVARTIASLEADVITLKVGINIVGSDGMKRRVFVPALHGFLDLVREGHPGTPIVVITAIACPGLEDTTGPVREWPPGHIVGTPSGREVDGTMTLSICRELVREVVERRAESDPDLFLFSGLDLFGIDDIELLPDDLHPNQVGYTLMADRFARAARDPATSIGRAFAPRESEDLGAHTSATTTAVTP